jgi:hypothetical protein
MCFPVRGCLNSVLGNAAVSSAWLTAGNTVNASVLAAAVGVPPSRVTVTLSTVRQPGFGVCGGGA